MSQRLPLTEKYRPRSLDEVVGQDKVVKAIRNLLERGLHPNLLFVGPPGVGKTTVAMCIAREFYDKHWNKTTFGEFKRPPEGGDWMSCFRKYNARNEVNVNLIRGELMRFTRFIGRRIILLDEADGLTKEGLEALRPLMEDSKWATFVLSCNDGRNIPEAVKSRCSLFQFEPITNRDVLLRLHEICRSEGLIQAKFPSEAKEAFNALVSYANGDMRKALNTLEQYISGEKIDYASMKKDLTL